VPGESGALADTAADFPRRVVDLVLDPLALEALRQHNRRVSAPFGWESAIARHLELYERATRMEVAA
jgi:hypothetical protein